jgi:hypothetical protein
LLVAAYDRTGPHLLQTAPDGNFYEWHAMALGARSQSAKTALERTCVPPRAGTRARVASLRLLRAARAASARPSPPPPYICRRLARRAGTRRLAGCRATSCCARRCAR